MNGTVVVMVTGSVLANGQGSHISDQRRNAEALADGLTQLFVSGRKAIVLHGNKPQVGFVLFRSELASHVLHPIPLDVCGADTQGATGYMLSMAFGNTLHDHGIARRVMCVVTQTRVEPDTPDHQIRMRSIGPFFDREKAEQYRQTRGWTIAEEPGRGYRRAVPCLQPLEIIEMDGIRQMVGAGDLVIASGGGGIPVIRNEKGRLEGLEAVVETEQVACLIGRELDAQELLMVVDRDDAFIVSGLAVEGRNELTVDELETFLAQPATLPISAESKLRAAAQFLRQGGARVVVTTLRRLSEALTGQGGLRIHAAAGRTAGE
ncbi:MAG TPA: hypothetical protein PK954_24065 [Anaerolineales bacterium]|nr:hypothetical protein [Anaerolineales bacterium]HRF46300.1 hypothetical protein [Anaerolineales bacterium]